MVIYKLKFLKTHPISLENRLSILPDGFVSKNRIEVEIRPPNMALWRFCEARTQIVWKPIDLETKE